MALSVVNSVNAGGAATASATTTGISITAGNLIVVGTLNYNANGVNSDVSVTDSVGNTYTKVGSCTLVGGEHCSIWYAKNVTGGASVTFTYNVTAAQADYPRLYVVQVAGADTTAPLDQSGFASNGTSGTTLSSPSLTTTLANEILFAIAGDNNTNLTTTFTDAGAATGGWTKDSFTSDGSTLEGAIGHAIVSSTGSYAVTSTVSSAATIRLLGLATFKAATVGLAAGTLTLGATGATTQALSLATNTGGTPPYSNQLQQSTNGGTTWTNVGAPVAGATASWTVTGLTPGQAYQFRVNPVTDSASGSATSNTVSVTIPATTITAPSAAKLAANTTGNTVKATGTATNWTAGNAEVQSLVDTGATAGTFTMTFGGQTTAAIAYNAAASAVQSALQALSSIGAGNVTCTGGPLPAAVTITFSGTLAPGPQALITTTSTGLTGGTAAVTRTTGGVAATAYSLAGLTGAAVTAATVNSATSVTLTVTSSTVDVAGTLTLSNNADSSTAALTVVSSVGGASRRRPQ